MPSSKQIRVFEHDALHLNQLVDGVAFEEPYLEALRTYHGESGTPYFQLTYKGVKFTAFVGVLQVGELTIEVLPKADKGERDKHLWHRFLIDMLRAVGFLDVFETGFSSLRLKSNSILDLYIELFVKEVRYLLQTGLVKKYRKMEGDSFSLKGSLLFSKNIQHNLVHAERFYVRHSTYDRDNIFNQLLYKALLLVQQIHTSSLQSGKIESLLLDFPECKDLLVNDALFEKLVFDRKTESYRKAIVMARLLLLNYHPDVRRGKNDVLALMFNMNQLWELYVYRMLRKELRNEFEVRSQVGANFWKPQGGRTVRIYPDMVVYKFNKEVVAVLDTKWKNVSGGKPSDDDLKQMFVYNLFYNSNNSVLLYPAVTQKNVQGNYSIKEYGSCSLIFLPLIKVGETMRLDLSDVKAYVKRIASIS